MAGEWRASTWGDEISLQYGKALRGHEKAQGRYRVFGANGPIGWTSEPLAQGPGVILGRKGAYRGVQYSPEPFFVIDTAYYVEPKSHLDMRWLYYAVKHYGLGDVDDGSPIPSTTRAAVYMLDLDVPPLSEQRAIAYILGCLDDKIELNRRTNETLEALARALFKSWFVDFDPVRAKMEGRQPFGMDDETAVLFPDSFEDSALGEIPKEWNVESIYSVADVIYGAPFSSKLFNEENVGLPILRIRDLATHSPKVYTPEEHPKGTKVRAGDIAVGMDGEFRAHIWTGPDAWMNQRVCMFVPKEGVAKYFAKESLREPLAFFERAKTGTTVIHLGKRDIDTFQLIVPSEYIMEAFAKLVEPITERTISNVRESRTLATIRDALLPKLLSGGVRVGEAEDVVEGVV